MPRCTRKGCGQLYDNESNTVCVHHSGAPVFHEGLKSWSCCSDVNKPVMEFDQFMKIPGCTEAPSHTDESPQVEAPKANAHAAPNMTSIKGAGGEETFTSKPSLQTLSVPLNENISQGASAPPPPIVEQEDDLSAVVTPGTECLRKGCGVKFVSDQVNRIGDGEGTVCVYHPSPPIFREGSKGYLCCKRRVLEFEEFLKIQGCKTGRHCFVPKSNGSTIEERTTCRIDHYQTLDKVVVSVFAKQADPERSKVIFQESMVSLDIYLPGSKRFVKDLELFGPINPSQSTSSFRNNKVELQLKKLDTRSWTVLEKTDRDLGGISLTFGVGGRTGTIGAKDLILDASNQNRT